ncbi:MAG: methyltransferase domain-containing protein [Candidatus Promineifilaceae bacterium]|jgi:tRNA (guanine6-N2)-methyltransferase
MKSAVTYYAQTMPGFEEIAWLEIRDRFPGATFGEYLYAKDQNGIIVFDYEGDMADLLQLRTTEDVFLLALNQPRMSRGKGDLARIVDLVGRSESFGRAANALLRWRKFSKPPTYRVISRKYGQHPYRRKDMETAVYRGLEARYPRWRAVEDGGQVEVWANMLGSQLLVGLRLSDRTMRHRYVKKVELPASLRPSMAAAMVHLTDPSPDDVFLDPMCGSGTILLERLHAGPYQNILGGDISQESVEATRLNLPQRRKGRKQQQISLRQWDAANLPLEDNTIDKVATNLPFGKKIGSEQDLVELYDGLFTELARVVVPEGRIVLLSSEYDLIKQLMRRHPHLEILSGYSVATKGVWGRIYLIRRVP